MKKIFITCLLIFSLSLNAKMLEPYESLKLLPECPFSYYENAHPIEALFTYFDIKVALEVGSWIGGGSTKHMGEMLKTTGGTLYAVDTWLGSSTQQPGQCHHQSCLDHVYQLFLSNMVHWDLTDTVIPCRMRSTEAAKCLNIKPDLIYIDGEHTTEAVYEDLSVWYPFVQEHGIICGDDWSWPTIRLAVETFAKENNLIIDTRENFWLLRTQ
ncbi:MAG: hypothetical protein SP1CHLAM54_12740 [Chlamydiia bacterium]|nr:hypothetical protein [Chlamydiia bacterium]MCH9616171.1 hypothetical protein [Chlamydiia bacterium]MCH9629843.1 hypothetical protein [Chlamydiia bacterium]